VLVFLVSWRSQLAGWRTETLQQLVQAETEGAEMIARALPRVSSSGLQHLLAKQLRDEQSHAAMFAGRWRALASHEAAIAGNALAENAVASGPLDEITLVAYLEVQERRALDILHTYVTLFDGDAETIEALQCSLRDEHYHAAWTHRQLERWSEAGKRAEVQAARQEAARVDRRAFRLQLVQFLRVLPRLLRAGIAPPFGGLKPAPTTS
jgi:hypothetical protein